MRFLPFFKLCTSAYGVPTESFFVNSCQQICFAKKKREIQVETGQAIEQSAKLVEKARRLEEEVASAVVAFEHLQPILDALGARDSRLSASEAQRKLRNDLRFAEDALKAYSRDDWNEKEEAISQKMYQKMMSRVPEEQISRVREEAKQFLARYQDSFKIAQARRASARCVKRIEWHGHRVIEISNVRRLPGVV